MRNLFIVLFCLMGTTAQALCTGPDFRDRLSPQARADIAQAAQRTPFGQGTQWTATQSNTVMTLVGTWHIYDPRMSAIAAGLADRIAAADLLLVEAGPKEQSSLSAAMSDTQNMTTLPDGQSLPDLLDSATWARLAEAANARNIPADKAAKMQPWYLALILSLPACAANDLANDQPGLDTMLINHAIDANTPVAALEPWNTLFKMMAEADLDTQLAQLQRSTLTPTITSDVFVALSERYFAGDIAGLMEISRLSAQAVPGVADPKADALFAMAQTMLIADRNARWMPLITQAAKTHNAIVVAVGAGHLPGENGILKILERTGWTITPAE